MSRLNSLRKQETSKIDRFPLLETAELSICLKSCNLNAPEEDLIKPTPIFVQSLYEQILECFVYINVNNFKFDDVEEDNIDSLRLITLHRVLYKFFVDCGITDFVLNDLIKPETNRTKRLLSAVVNFARFREEHLYDNESIIAQNNMKFEEFNKQTEINKQFKEKIGDLSKNNEKILKNLDELNHHNKSVEIELKQLKKVQEGLTNEHSDYKIEKTRLIQQLEDHNFLLLESKKELEKMKSYIIESPEIITKIINDMNHSLKLDEKALNEIETRSRNLAITTESFNIINTDLKILLKSVDELSLNLTNSSNNSIKLIQLKDQFDDKSLKLNELDRKIQLLTRQIKNINEKISRTSSIKSTKESEYEKKLNQLHDYYKNLMVEKNETDKELNIKRKYIEKVGNEMNSLEMEFKKEYDESVLEITRLNSHVKLYLDQIEKKLDLDNTTLL